MQDGSSREDALHALCCTLEGELEEALAEQTRNDMILRCSANECIRINNVAERRLSLLKVALAAMSASDLRDTFGTNILSSISLEIRNAGARM